MNEERDRPTTTQPLNAKKRSLTPILWVLLILLAAAAIYALTGYLRYET
jgi:hypothetical protein